MATPIDRKGLYRKGNKPESDSPTTEAECAEHKVQLRLMTVAEFYPNTSKTKGRYALAFWVMVMAILATVSPWWLAPAIVVWWFVRLFAVMRAEDKDLEIRGQWYWEYLESHGYTNVPNL